ncbi:hypothetical protein IJD44_06750, partial [bacterium]|nr:hypothetical protein [bacterium]
ILRNLFNLYEHNKENDKSVVEFPDFMFYLLAGNKFLEDTMEIMEKPLNSKEQNNFLGKMEDLMAIALQIELLWEVEESKIASSFVLKYTDLLCSLYKQNIYILKLKSRKECDLEEFKKLIFKKAKDIGLLKNIEEIRFFFNQIKEKKVLEKLKEQIKLK